MTYVTLSDIRPKRISFRRAAAKNIPANRPCWSDNYTNLSAAEVREALLAKGYDESQLPSERTIRDILNRMNYRLKRIQKGKPLKKTEHTDDIFANVHAARERYQDDPESLEISADTKAKVSLGEYVLGGEKRELTVWATSPKAGTTILRQRKSWSPSAF